MEQEKEVTRATYKSKPLNYGTLGKRIQISPKAMVSLNGPGYQMTQYTPSVEVLIGIGKDHVAHLIMDQEAWEALKAGEEVNIDTLKEFREKFL